MEALFSQRGYRRSNPSTQYDATHRSYYLTLPVLLKFSHRKFYAEAGPQVDYMTGIYHKFIYQDRVNPGLQINVNTNVEPFPRWSAAYVLGIGYKWSDKVGLNLRYFNNLTDIYYYFGSRDHHPKMAGLQLTASYELLGQ